MVRKFSVLLVFVALLVAIVPAFAQGGVQIPEVVEGKTNVAVVLIGPINDGGWSQAHYDGAVYMKENLENQVQINFSGSCFQSVPILCLS